MPEGTAPAGRHQPIRWPELIATVGIMLSLLFVGIQIRQNTAAIRAGTYQDLAAQANDINLALANNPGLAATYGTFRGTSSDTTEATLRALVLALVRLAENAYYMGRLGTYDDRLLQRFEANPMYGTTAFAEWWQANQNRFAADFRSHMDSVMTATRARNLGGR